VKVTLYGTYTGKTLRWGDAVDWETGRGVSRGFWWMEPQPLVSFGTDEAGEIYVVGYEGMIYKLDFAGTRFKV
jgi:hypothetical protein